MTDDRWDRILAVGGAFDWLSPTAATLQDAYLEATRRGHHTFLWPRRNAPYSLRDAVRALQRRGLAPYGALTVGDWAMLSVPGPQAEAAFHVLRELGLEVAAPPETTGGCSLTTLLVLGLTLLALYLLLGASALP